MFRHVTHAKIFDELIMARVSHSFTYLHRQGTISWTRLALWSIAVHTVHGRSPCTLLRRGQISCHSSAIYIAAGFSNHPTFFEPAARTDGTSNCPFSDSIPQAITSGSKVVSDTHLFSKRFPHKLYSVTQSTSSLMLLAW